MNMTIEGRDILANPQTQTPRHQGESETTTPSMAKPILATPNVGRFPVGGHPCRRRCHRYPPRPSKVFPVGPQSCVVTVVMARLAMVPPSVPCGFQPLFHRCRHTPTPPPTSVSRRINRCRHRCRHNPTPPHRMFQVGYTVAVVSVIANPTPPHRLFPVA